MGKIKVVLELEEDKWDFLCPVLSPYVVPEEQNAIDDLPIEESAIQKLHNGTRIMATLQNGRWNTPSGNITTVGELKRITRTQYLRCRNAGVKSWSALQAYIDSLK